MANQHGIPIVLEVVLEVELKKRQLPGKEWWTLLRELVEKAPEGSIIVVHDARMKRAALEFAEWNSKSLIIQQRDSTKNTVILAIACLLALVPLSGLFGAVGPGLALFGVGSALAFFFLMIPE